MIRQDETIWRPADAFGGPGPASDCSARYYELAGISFKLESDIPFQDDTFESSLAEFRCSGPGVDLVTIRYSFTLPNLAGADLGSTRILDPRWSVYQRDSYWTYLQHAAPARPELDRIGVFTDRYTRARIYHRDRESFVGGGLWSLTGFPRDQLLLGPLLADREGCYLHSAAMVLRGQGLLFCGHSGTGKSTVVGMLRDEGTVLCDERVIVRRWPEGFRIYGTWKHSSVPEVSSQSAPLRAIFLLEQAPENRLVPVSNRREVIRSLPFFLARPVVTPEWWEKSLDLLGALAREVPVYRLRFDLSGGVRDLLRRL